MAHTASMWLSQTKSGCSMGQSTPNSRGALVRVHAPLDEPTVLLLHGFLGCAADWEHVAAALSLTCRCISIDLPGHGASVVNATGVCPLINTPSMPAVAPVRYAEGTPAPWPCHQELQPRALLGHLLP